MKNLVILSGLFVLLSGCTEDDILIRKAENHLKDYLDYPGSYRRISWRITDTLKVNDFLFEQLKEPLSIQEEKLAALSQNMPIVCDHLKSVREAINSNINGSYSDNQDQSTRVSWIERQKAAELVATRERMNVELESWLNDSTDLSNELSGIEFRRDSIMDLMKTLKTEDSEIRQIRLEVRFRTKVSGNQYGTFCSKMMFAGDEPEVLDTYYDGIKLR